LEAKQTKQETSRRVMEAKHSSYHKVIDAWNCTHGKIETIAPLSKTPKPEPDWQERSLEQSMVDADLILSRRFQAAGNPHAAVVLSQRARLWLTNEKPSTNIVPSPINGANVMQQAQALEAQISTLTKATRTELLFKAVVDFLSHRGESERMASWVIDLQMSEGEIAAPHDGPPVVSVVIPCHNYGNYLTECVESVLRQRFRAWELIIINDGSTDNTHEVAKEILQKYPAHAIRYIKQKCHGIVQPRNRGVTLAKGEFILPLDADDLIAPEFLNKTVPEMIQNPDLGYISTKALFFGSVNSIWPSEPFNCVNLLVTNQQTNSTLYRKRMWKEIGGYNEQMIHGYVDWEFWIRATKLGWIGKQLDEPLFFYRRKAKSVVTQAKTKDIKIKEQIIRLHPDVYDLSKIRLCKNEMCRENWIPPVLIRDGFSIPKKFLNEGETIAHGYNAEKIVLGLLEQLLPSAKHIFTMPESGKGDPSIYLKLYSKLSNKSTKLIEQGLHEKAVETSASLLALFPTVPSAGILMAKTLLRTSRIEEAYNFAKHFQSLFPMEQNFRDITTNLLHSIAKSTLKKQQSMALLDAACILSPKDKKLWAELASCAYERDQIRAAQRALSIARDKPVQPDPETACIWYITDTFGFGAGGINGVTQAKFMTLSSIIRGNTGPNIVVITKWHTDLPEALAEFSIFCENIYGKGGFRWPLWIALENDQYINQHPRWKYTENPCLIIEEGVLLEGHRFLNTLHEIPTCQRAFIHHTSPQQYTGEFEYKNLFNEAQEALVQYDHHICVSSNVIKEWIQIDELDSKNWVYIPNCAHEEEADRLLKINIISLRKELGLSQNALIYLCLASVQTRKGHDILLDQMEKVLNSIDNAQLICIGPIHEEWSGKDIVQNARNRFNLNQVRFLGVRRNALEYVRACDCLVLPSREEALPLVILEAMALSKPCIASNVNGIPELIEHGETGFLFSLQEQNDLALHMITLANHPELMKSMGKKAKQRYYDKFRRQIHADHWKSFIDSVINNSIGFDSSIYQGSIIHKSMRNNCHSMTPLSKS
jgi:glycosyltransferase involved in cell wall biosynthesis